MTGSAPDETTPLMETLPYSRQGALTGVRRALPVAVSTFTIALVFGVLARQTGLSILETLLMSALVFAGAAQFVALGLWTTPLPIVTIIVTTLIVNLRHILMGAALRPWFARLPAIKAYATLFLLVDESWALTVGNYATAAPDGGFLLGSGFTLYAAWVGGTAAGSTLGTVIHDPAALGLDFAFTAVFLALLVGLWKGKDDLLPWAAAALTSVTTSHVLAGKWYILLGGLAGSVVGAMRRAR